MKRLFTTVILINVLSICYGQNIKMIETDYFVSEFWTVVSAEFEQDQKDSLLTLYTKKILENNSSIDTESLEVIIVAYRNNNKNPKYRFQIDMLYEKLAEKNIGQTIPNFEFKNKDGNVINLYSFKGKPLYIDVWASFCEPCIRQIDDYNSLVEKYKEINFIAISHDHNKDSWLNTIANRNFKGIHLIDEENRESEFNHFFKIRMIPRYILVDKDMKIISVKTFKPGEPELIEIIEKLL